MGDYSNLTVMIAERDCEIWLDTGKPEVRGEETHRKRILIILVNTLRLHIKILPSTAVTTAAHLSKISIELHLLQHYYHYLL